MPFELRLLPIKALLLSLTVGTVYASEQPPAFSETGLQGWETESFKGQTTYQIVTAGQQEVLFAHAKKTASGVGWEGEPDLQKTPWLHWCWWVEATYPGLDETTKAGDDYPARVYAVASTGFFRWQVQALNYVWASEKPVGSDWPNAFTSRAHLVALQSGDEHLNQWIPESRNLAEDFATYFNNPEPRLQALALMTDGDNAQVEGRAWYTDLQLTADQEHPGCPSESPENSSEVP